MNMKTILLALAVFGIFSCTKAETDITEKSPEYIGTMTVIYDGEEFVTGNVSVMVGMSEDSATMDIKMLKVKFVPAMPVRIDVLIPGVRVESVSDDGGTVVFSGDGIIPYALGGEYKKFVVSGLSGKIDNGTLSFDLVFGEYPTSYEGYLR